MPATCKKSPAYVGDVLVSLMSADNEMHLHVAILSLQAVIGMLLDNGGTLEVDPSSLATLLQLIEDKLSSIKPGITAADLA